MTPTSDERREVAARLRATKAECDERGYPWMVEDLMQALGFGTYEDGEDGIFDLLAELIDPTCELEPMPAYVPSHRFIRWRCKKCGAVCFAPLNATRPRYCLNCGARVVSGGERR